MMTVAPQLAPQGSYLIVSIAGLLVVVSVSELLSAESRRKLSRILHPALLGLGIVFLSYILGKLIDILRSIV